MVKVSDKKCYSKYDCEFKKDGNCNNLFYCFYQKIEGYMFMLLKIDVEKAIYISAIIGLCIVIPVQYFIFNYSLNLIFFSDIVGLFFAYFMFRFLIDKRILKDNEE